MKATRRSSEAVAAALQSKADMQRELAEMKQRQLELLAQLELDAECDEAEEEAAAVMNISDLPKDMSMAVRGKSQGKIASESVTHGLDEMDVAVDREASEEPLFDDEFDEDEIIFTFDDADFERVDAAGISMFDDDEEEVPDMGKKRVPAKVSMKFDAVIVSTHPNLQRKQKEISNNEAGPKEPKAKVCEF